MTNLQIIIFSYSLGITTATYVIFAIHYRTPFFPFMWAKKLLIKSLAGPKYGKYELKNASDELVRK